MSDRRWLTLLSVLSAAATAVILLGGGPSTSALELAAGRVAAAPTTVALPAPTQADATTDVDDVTADDSAATADDAGVSDVTPEDTASSGDDTETADSGDDVTPAGPQPAADEPRETHVGHVFTIVLAGHGFDATFGPSSPATYLNSQLRPKGALLSGYSSLGSADLPDHLALISGQPPNEDTRARCTTYTEIPQTAKPTKSGEIRDTGCAYPNTITTIADQVSASGRTWRAYAEDLEKTGRTSCRRPTSSAPDDTLTARPGDGYATRHNPFVYFHSLLDLGGCDANDLPLDKLEADLADAKTTPAFSYIAPNLCNDGTESPCIDGSPGGLVTADAFLARWVPKILASPAFADDGLLVVVFAGNAAAGAGGTVTNAPSRNGALVVSRYATAGSTSDAELDPYGLLRTFEDVLALKPLARAAAAPSLLDTTLAAARIPRPGDD